MKPCERTAHPAEKLLKGEQLSNFLYYIYYVVFFGDLDSYVHKNERCLDSGAATGSDII